jgi:hypothetical protein
MDCPRKQPRVGGISAEGGSKWRKLKLLPIEPQGESLCDQTLHMTVFTLSTTTQRIARKVRLSRKAANKGLHL